MAKPEISYSPEWQGRIHMHAGNLSRVDMDRHRQGDCRRS